MRRFGLVIVAVVLAGLAVGGCRPGQGGRSSPPSSTGVGEVEILALAKEVAQCLRSNGLPGFPDPYFDNGRLELPPVDDNVKQQGQAALDGPCREVWQRLEAVLPDKRQDQRPAEESRLRMAAEDLEKLKQFTECMRGHGLPNWPDPDETGLYHLGQAGLPEGLGKGDRPVDATFREAATSCEPFAVQGMGFAN